jgi:hypothetical protein
MQTKMYTLLVKNTKLLIWLGQIQARTQFMPRNIGPRRGLPDMARSLFKG